MTFKKRFPSWDIGEHYRDVQRIKEAVASAVLGVNFKGYDKNSEKALIKMQNYIHEVLGL